MTKRWVRGWAALRGLALVGLGLVAHTACGPERDEPVVDETESDGGLQVATKSQAMTLAPIVAVADTSVRQSTPYANDGVGVNLSVSSVSGSGQRSLIRFDESAIAAAVGTDELYRARVELTVTGLSDGWGGGELAIHAMTHSWPEGNGTYAGIGTHGPMLGLCR